MTAPRGAGTLPNATYFSSMYCKSLISLVRLNVGALRDTGCPRTEQATGGGFPKASERHAIFIERHKCLKMFWFRRSASKSKWHWAECLRHERSRAAFRPGQLTFVMVNLFSADLYTSACDSIQPPRRGHRIRSGVSRAGRDG